MDEHSDVVTSEGDGAPQDSDAVELKFAARREDDTSTRPKCIAEPANLMAYSAII